MSSKNRPKIPNYMIFVNYFCRIILIIFGLLSEFFCVSRIKELFLTESNRESYPRLYDKFFCFYYRNITSRFWDILAFPICTMPSANITILERKIRNKYIYSFIFLNVLRRFQNKLFYLSIE